MRLTLPIICLLLAGTPLSAGIVQNEIPQYDHVIVVIEENHAYNQLIGSANAAYINHLAKGGVLFTNSHGIGHPSQPNYLALFSGSTQGTTEDECLEGKTPFKTPNLGEALIDKKFSFKGYAQTMPSAGFLGCTYLYHAATLGALYARKHVPWVNWLGTGPNTIPPSASVPMTEFPKDFSKLPTVSFVIPDMDYDMHNIGLPGDAAAIRRGDKWLKDNLADYVDWAKKHNSLLILTFDEDDFDPKNGNRIPTIFYGAKVSPGEYTASINHYNVLHTLEAMYGLPFTDNAVAAPISGIWGK
ncbi:MAG TPA: alkaline phosphatase family protein [Mucilaginibacter sp.]